MTQRFAARQQNRNSAKDDRELPSLLDEDKEVTILKYVTGRSPLMCPLWSGSKEEPRQKGSKESIL